jgi:YaiO family outer membrane protein
MDASLRPHGPWSVALGIERTHRFARDEHTARAGVTRAVGQQPLLVSAGIQIAPGAETVPRHGGFIQLDWSARPRWKLGTMARVIRFSTGSATILRTNVTRILGGDWEATYDLSWARDVAGNHDFTHVGRLLFPLSYRSSAQFEILRGIDAERVGTSLGAQTVKETGVNASLRLYLSSSWGVRILAGYTDRERTYRSRTLGLGIIRHL